MSSSLYSLDDLDQGLHLLVMSFLEPKASSSLLALGEIFRLRQLNSSWKKDVEEYLKYKKYSFHPLSLKIERRRQVVDKLTLKMREKENQWRSINIGTLVFKGLAVVLSGSAVALALGFSLGLVLEVNILVSFTPLMVCVVLASAYLLRTMAKINRIREIQLFGSASLQMDRRQGLKLAEAYAFRHRDIQTFMALCPRANLDKKKVLALTLYEIFDISARENELDKRQIRLFPASRDGGCVGLSPVNNSVLFSPVVGAGVGIVRGSGLRLTNTPRGLGREEAFEVVVEP
jgi:hypothetical protein